MFVLLKRRYPEIVWTCWARPEVIFSIKGFKCHCKNLFDSLCANYLPPSRRYASNAQKQVRVLIEKVLFLVNSQTDITCTRSSLKDFSDVHLYRDTTNLLAEPLVKGHTWNITSIGWLKLNNSILWCLSSIPACPGVSDLTPNSLLEYSCETVDGLLGV